MLSEQELIAYLDDMLSPAERQRVEAELERDPQQRHRLIRQMQLDAALRASLGKPAENERVKQSILAVLRGETEAAIKQKVLADARPAASPDNSKPPLIGEKVFDFIKKIFSRGLEFAGIHRRATACALLLCLGLAAWLVIPGASRNMELPVSVRLHTGAIQASAGQIIRSGKAGSATVTFADGTTLHLEPGTEISLVAVDSTRSGGKQLKLLTGSFSAAVAKQPEGLPLLIQTPHALVTVVGTEFDLSVATNRTALEVTHGLVKMTGSGNPNPVSVAAGEFAVASSQSPLRYGRLARHPFLWPFSSASLWNRPLGSDAQFAPVPGKSFLADGPLQGALRPRRPFLGSATDPLRRIWVEGEVRADIRLPSAHLPESGMTDSLVLLQHARRYALELRGITVRADGDLEAKALAHTDLAGAGVEETADATKPFGFSNLGGLLRSGEWEQGIRHALAARVGRDRLTAQPGNRPATIWPAVGGDVAKDATLGVGSLLAIPPDVDIAAKFGTNGPAYELARAMQDYGVYVTGPIDAPFVLLADDARLPGANDLLTQLVPLLQIVTNNSPAVPAKPRREVAPEFSPR